MKMIAAATTEQMVRLFDVLSTAKGAAMISQMDPPEASHVFEGMRIGKAVEVVSEMQEPRASLVFEQMATGKAVEMMGKMDISKASRVWGGMSPLPAGAVFEAITVDIGSEIIDLLPEERLIPRLPEVSAERLWSTPVQFLLEQLPSVPATQRDSWNEPVVHPTLPPRRTGAADLDSLHLHRARGEGKRVGARRRQSCADCHAPGQVHPLFE